MVPSMNRPMYISVFSSTALDGSALAAAGGGTLGSAAAPMAGCHHPAHNATTTTPIRDTRPINGIICLLQAGEGRTISELRFCHPTTFRTMESGWEKEMMQFAQKRRTAMERDSRLWEVRFSERPRVQAGGGMNNAA